jgi:hypothetical protein
VKSVLLAAVAVLLALAATGMVHQIAGELRQTRQSIDRLADQVERASRVLNGMGIEP